MCEEIRDYRQLFQDNEHVSRLNHLDNVITEHGDWEYWAIEAPLTAGDSAVESPTALRASPKRI
jgi:hypothetical protein